MKVSVVTISFNQMRFLRACIESVLSQSHDDVEYIVVDPGSVDGSRDLIRTYSDRIARVILEPDRGPADGLNKGLACATGEIFGYINADDMYLPGALSRIAEYFGRCPDVDVIYGNGYQIDENGYRTRNLFSTRWGLNRYAFGAANVVQQATFFRRRACERVGGFNVSNQTCWDGELLVDVALGGGSFLRVRDFLGAFRIHKKSITGSGRLSKQYQADQARVAEKILRRPRRRSDAVWEFGYHVAKVVGHPWQSAYKGAMLLKQGQRQP